MTTDSMTTTAFDQLVQSLRGELILPDHPEYDAARRVYNGMIDRHPAAIARCRDAADVRACVEFARDRSDRARRPWRRPQRWRPRCLGRRPGHRSQR